MNRPRNPQAAEWFVKLVCAKDMDALLPDFRRWLDECPENRAAFRGYERLWQLMKCANPPPPLVEMQAAQEPARVQALPRRALTREGGRRAPKLSRVGVAWLALGPMWAMGAFRPTPEAPATALAWSRVETGPFEVHRTVPLWDQTKVQLDANTVVELTWNAARGEVVLERGRALFTVGDRCRLAVSAGGLVVVGGGTVFSVGRESRDEILTMVRMGRVKLIPRTSQLPSPPRVLMAGEAARASGDLIRMERRLEADSDPRMNWVKGVFEFKDTPLWKAIAAFNRYNALQLQLDDPTLADERIEGHYAATEPEHFARALHELDIRYVLGEADQGHAGVIRLKGPHP
jgi:transmembrane sensor